MLPPPAATTDHAHRLGPLRGLGEERHDERQRDDRDDGAAEALDRPRRDQHLLRGGQPARERGEREQHEADKEQLAVPEEVAEAPAEQQKTSEGQQVGIDDPRKRRLGESQLLADRWQRDVHDRCVEHDHQVAHAENDQGDPARAAVQGGGHGRGPLRSFRRCPIDRRRPENSSFGIR